jgi:TRAP-type mannitol/chloroaromatic compound transport system permease large subunit
MWLLVGGNCFDSFLGLSGVRDWIANIVVGLPLNDLGILLIMLFIVFILGMFVDGGVIIVLCIPIFMPIVASRGIDSLWFSILFVICIVSGYLTPPFGMNIFYFQGLGFTDVSTQDIYRAVVPYVLLMLVTLVICIAFPHLCTWLPSTM